MLLKISTNFYRYKARKLYLSKLCVLGILLIAMQTVGFSQNRPINGTVRSQQGDILPGVNIVIKGTTRGTTTDSNGRYTIVASDGDILVFSFIGFAQQEIPVGNQTAIDVSLPEDIRNLSEVVITAFGIEREKKGLGYSVQEVEARQLAEAREPNIMNSLKGRVAGVHVNPSAGGPAGSTYVEIRGNSSLTGNNQPLYVVDGVPIDNQTLDAPNIGSGVDFGDGINNINPDDVETITVLKGPSAAALYGARGANGVILITTKKGVARKGIGIDINSNATFERPNVLPTFQNKWGGGYDDDYGVFNKIMVDGQEVFQWPVWLLDHWGGEMDGRPMAVQAWPELGVVPYSAQPADNIKDFYQTGTTFTNTIGLSGGNEKTTFRFSVSDMHNKGIVPNSKLNRQTVNVRVVSKINDRLNVEGKINYVRQHSENLPGSGIGFLNPSTNLNIVARFIDLDWLKDYKREDGSMINYKNQFPYNPYWVVNEFLNEGLRDRIIGLVRTQYNFTDWLSLQARAGTDFYTDTRFSRIPAGTPSFIDGQVRNNQFHVREENADVLLTASGKLSADLTGSLSAGANHLNRRQEATGYTGNNLNIEGLYHINNAKSVIPRYDLIRRQMNSVYFMGQVAYKNFLFLDVTGRNDWSSTLGLNDNSFFYPSVSTSFVFTDAVELNSKILTSGKLRASYAEAGNDASPYMTSAGYFLLNTSFNGQAFATIGGNVPLLDLKNELTSSYEFGTDLRLFNNKLGIDITYYDASTTNQILPVEISATTGYSSRLINAGEIRNRGVEVFINSNPLTIGDFRWDLTINFSRNKSEVISLAPGIQTHTLISGASGSIEARPGELFGNIIGYPYMRNENGDILLRDNGVWQRGNERVILGNIQPDFLSGISNSFGYKGFVLSGLFDLRKGGQVLSYSKYDQMAKGTGKFTEHRENLIADGVIRNPDGTYRKSDIVLVSHDYYANGGPWGNIAEPLVIDADYVALRELTLSYEFRPTFIQKTPMTSMKLSIVGRNLLYLYRDPEFKLMGISPETAFNTTAAAQGYEARIVPTTRSMGINLSISF